MNQESGHFSIQNPERAWAGFFVDIIIKIAFFAVFVLLFTLVGPFFSTLSENLEKSSFEKASAQNTVGSFEEYLAKYPEGRFAAEARAGKSKLLFQRALELNTVNEWAKFLKTHPEGELAEEARTRMEKLIYEDALEKDDVQTWQAYLARFPEGRFRAEAEKAVDRLDFEAARDVGDPSAYSKYLFKHPDGAYVEQARKGSDAWRWKQARDLDTIEAYQSYLDHYPNGAHRENALKALQEARFAQAETENSLDAFLTFISDFPENEKVPQAKKHLAELAFEKAVAAARRRDIPEVSKWLVMADKYDPGLPAELPARVGAVPVFAPDYFLKSFSEKYFLPLSAKPSWPTHELVVEEKLVKGGVLNYPDGQSRFSGSIILKGSLVDPDGKGVFTITTKVALKPPSISSAQFVESQDQINARARQLASFQLDNLLKEKLAAYGPKLAPPIGLASFGPEVKSVRFFASKERFTYKAMRSYLEEIESSRTMFLNWELVVETKEKAFRDVEVQVEAEFYLRGRLVGKSGGGQTLSSGERSLEITGNWTGAKAVRLKPGDYTVKFKSGDFLITEANLRVL